jgi:hypothetical protein
MLRFVYDTQSYFLAPFRRLCGEPDSNPGQLRPLSGVCLLENMGGTGTVAVCNKDPKHTGILFTINLKF